MKYLIFLIDIFFITVIEIIAAFILSIGVDKYFFIENHQDDENESTIHLLLKTCFFCGILSIVTYFTGIIVQHIPFPFDGFYGYKHASYSEVKTLTILSVFVLIFCDSIQYKLTILRKRL